VRAERTSAHPIVRARRATRARLENRTAGQGEDGFTLIELIIVTAVLPIIIGSITVALLSVLTLSGGVNNRISDSNDALIASSNFNRDVQSAVEMTTSSTVACGASTGTQVLGLQWGANSSAPGGYQTVVSYVTVPTPANGTGGTTTYSLVRQVCTSGTSATPTSTTTVSHDIGSQTFSNNPADTPSLVIYGPATGPDVFADLSYPTNSFSTWNSTDGVTKVALTVDEPGSSYNFSLVGLPGETTTSGGTTTTTTPVGNNGCNFASPGSGTYANQLCFIDFTGYTGASYTPPTTSAPCSGQAMSGQVANTPYTVKFCIAQAQNQYFQSTAQPTTPANYTPAWANTPWPIPTYYEQQYDSEAFLGNNGFYTGVPGNPAIYEHTCSSSNVSPSSNNNVCTSGGQATLTTVYITDFQVFDAAGQAATGWTLVTGDAESTDTNEWMDFTSATSGITWSILPNNGASDPYGNACYNGANNGVGLLQWKGSIPATPTGVGVPSNGVPAQSAQLTIAPKTYATGASSILCEANQQLNKTGTLMLSAQEPNGSSAGQNITVTMLGSGWGEAMFLGVLL